MKNFKLENETIWTRAEHNKENPYFSISQKLNNDERLNLIDFGLMVKILTNSDNYIFYSTVIHKKTKLGKILYYKSLNNLIDFGYIKKTYKKTGGVIWEMIEEPQTTNTKKTTSTTTKKQSSQLVDNHRILGIKDTGNNSQLVNNHRIPENGNMGNNILEPDILKFSNPGNNNENLTPSQLVNNHRIPEYRNTENETLITNNILPLFQKSSTDEFLEKNKPQDTNLEPRILGKNIYEIEVKDLFVVSPSSTDYGVNNGRENLSPSTEEQKTEEQKYSPINEEQKKEPSINDLIKNIINGNKKIGLPTEKQKEEQKNSIPNIEQPEQEHKNNTTNEEQKTEHQNRTSNEEQKNSIPNIEQPEREINFGTARPKPKTEQQKQNINIEQPKEEIYFINEICSLTFGEKIPNWEKLILNLGIEKFVSRNIEYFETDKQLYNDVQTFYNYRTKK